jgi:ketosteroid isomerase-like protein
MNDAVAEIEAMFQEFERAARSQEWGRYEQLFLPTFLSLDPATATPIERDALIAFLPRRRDLFDRAGASGTRLSTLEIIELDPIHALARTTWAVEYDQPHEPVTLRSTFTLRRTENGWRIAVYLNHESLLELLGLNPTQVASPDPMDERNPD